MSEHEAKQATPAAELERQIMDSNVPKSEREWWAAREIESLRSVNDPHADIVKRLSGSGWKASGCAALMLEAASEIERLRKPTK